MTHPSDGIYCIDPGPEIDPSTAVMVVGEENTFGETSDTTDNVAQVEWDSTPLYGPGGTMEVVIFLGFGKPGTGGQLDQGGFRLDQHDQGFTLVIP